MSCYRYGIALVCWTPHLVCEGTCCVQLDNVSKHNGLDVNFPKIGVMGSRLTVCVTLHAFSNLVDKLLWEYVTGFQIACGHLQTQNLGPDQVLRWRVGYMTRISESDKGVTDCLYDQSLHVTNINQAYVYAWAECTGFGL